jgi:hypothetical protein
VYLGIPIVTRVGDLWRNRIGAAILTRVGLGVRTVTVRPTWRLRPDPTMADPDVWYRVPCAPSASALSTLLLRHGCRLLLSGFLL